MTPILELRTVCKEFAGSTVLRDIDLRVAEGDFVSIIGYSGTGKSTLMNLIAGLLKPDSGHASMAGEKITGPGPISANLRIASRRILGFIEWRDGHT